MERESNVLMETTKNWQCFLPVEMLTNIFGYLDPHMLLKCRSVCKFWKDVAESPGVWKIQIRQRTQRNEALDNILPTVHSVYPWYICYAICKNIFGVNLFPRAMIAGRYLLLLI